jgi:hypothetical protein
VVASPLRGVVVAFSRGVRPFRSAAVFVVAFGGLVAGTGSAAFASAGCDAANSGASNIGTSAFLSFSNFAVGDSVTFTVVETGPFAPGVPPPTGTVSYSLSSGDNTPLASQTGLALPATITQSYTVTGNHQDTTLKFQASATLPVTVTASCTPAPSNTNMDSQKLQALEVLVTKIVAQSSGAAITGAIDNAIDDAFNGGGTPFSFGPNGAAFNFAAEPAPSALARGDHEALNALAYAGGGNFYKAPPAPILTRDWSAWADVRGTGWNNNPSAGFSGDQVNATAGLGRKLTPDILVGLIAGYEHFNYDVAALTGTMKGDGGTVGGYAAWRLTPTLRWDAKLAWSDIAYDGTAGTADGSFTGHRWLASTGLTGRYQLAGLVFEPSSNVFALWERDTQWTDSLGTLQPERDFSAGRVATGGKLIAPWQSSWADLTVAPYAGVYADWRFSTDNALPAGLPVVGFGDGWSGRVSPAGSP